jgi:hypothetical protein
MRKGERETERRIKKEERVEGEVDKGRGAEEEGESRGLSRGGEGRMMRSSKGEKGEGRGGEGLDTLRLISKHDLTLNSAIL